MGGGDGGDDGGDDGGSDGGGDGGGSNGGGDDGDGDGGDDGGGGDGDDGGDDGSGDEGGYDGGDGGGDGDDGDDGGGDGGSDGGGDDGSSDEGGYDGGDDGGDGGDDGDVIPWQNSSSVTVIDCQNTKTYVETSFSSQPSLVGHENNLIGCLSLDRAWGPHIRRTGLEMRGPGSPFAQPALILACPWTNQLLPPRPTLYFLLPKLNRVDKVEGNSDSVNL